MSEYGSYEQQRWLPAVNGAGQTIPAFACVKVTSVSTSGVLTVEKSDGDDFHVHCFAHHMDTGDGKEMEVTFDLPTWALYTGSPSNGNLLAPQSGSYELAVDNSTGVFAVLGGADGTKVYVGPPRCGC